jgi:hypothetical protein
MPLVAQAGDHGSTEVDDNWRAFPLMFGYYHLKGDNVEVALAIVQ